MQFQLSRLLLAICTFGVSFGYSQAQDLAQNSSLPTAQKQALLLAQKSAFEENKGQVTGADAPQVRYFYQEGGLSMFLLPTGIAYQFNRLHYPEGYKPLDKFASTEEREKMEEIAKAIRTETYRMDVELVGANPQARITTEGKSADYIQYYNHNALDVHSYSRVTYHEIYPNIDWVLYKTEAGALKYDFVVRTGGDPAQIRLRTQHAEAVELNKDGGITLKNRMGSITEKAPVSLQGSEKIATRFAQEGDYLRFDLGDYDRSQTLIIDPNLIWATYYGGIGVGGDAGYDCVVDASNNVYLAGLTNSSTNIAASGHQTTYNGGNGDAFLVKFNSAGTRQWATYYGGTGTDAGYACAVEANGNVYMTGYTTSTSNIASGGHQNAHYGNAGADAFLVKFNAAAVRQWATYYGGAISESGSDCAVDASGNVYLLSHTRSTGLAFNGHQNTTNGTTSDALLVKFNSTGLRLWATYYGGTSAEVARTCSVDDAENVYIAGSSASSAGVASSGHQNVYAGGTYDGFLAKFNSAGTIQWATYYGGSSTDEVYGSAVDASGNIYIAGNSNSTTGIASGGHQNAFAGTFDAFLVKFNSAGARQWATYYGGTNTDYGQFCATDANANVYLAGQTNSTTSIAANGHLNTFGGGSTDAFLAKFNSTGTRQWATYYGGSNTEDGWSCSTDASGNVYLAGQTESNTNIASGGHQNTYAGTVDAFLAKFLGSLCAPTSATITQASCSNFTLNGTVYSTSGTYTQTRSNAAGCDSTITLNLTINQPSSATITQSSCTSFTLNGTTYTTSGTYTQTRTNTAGCDSTITLNLTINQPSSATITQSSCTSFTLNGTTYTASGTYTQNRTNAAGCDSSITLNLTINALPNAAISENAGTLTAAQAGAAYQWLDCDNANTPIAGAIAQSFTPTASGNYAVSISLNGCTAVSNCINFVFIGIEREGEANDAFRLYPNPTTSGQIFLQDLTQGRAGALHVELYDALGRNLWTKELSSSDNLHSIALPSVGGAYILRLRSASGSVQTWRIVSTQ